MPMVTQAAITSLRRVCGFVANISSALFQTARHGLATEDVLAMSFAWLMELWAGRVVGAGRLGMVGSLKGSAGPSSGALASG